MTGEPPSGQEPVIGGVCGNQPAMEAFARINAGISPAEFGAAVAAAQAAG